MTGRPKKSPFLFKNHPINYFLRPITHPKPFNQPKLTHWEQNYYIIYDWNKNIIIIFALYY